MRFEGSLLQPAESRRAGPGNYTWWNKSEKYEPLGPVGFMFTNKEAFANQILLDFPDGREVNILGAPYTHGTGCAIGGPGFGWVELGDDKSQWTRFPHIGNVWFGREVELGSNVTIDRGAIGDTEIGSGVKIDNGVHVGHSAYIGGSTRIAAHAIIGGSVGIGIDCWIGLGAIIKQHLTIGNSAIIGMGAIVLKDVPAGETWVGNPAHRLVK